MKHDKLHIMELYIYKIYQDAPNIEYGTNEAACFDISAYIPYQASVNMYTKDNKLVEMLSPQDDGGRNFIEIPEGWRALIPTGLVFKIPLHHSVRLYARSGLSVKNGLNLINCVGIIDADYAEQVFIPLYNNSQGRVKIYNGDRIAQGEMVFNNRTIINYTTERPPQKGNRNGGFGSTGV